MDLLIYSCKSTSGVVKNIDEFNSLAESAHQGDRIVLANGSWSDLIGVKS